MPTCEKRVVEDGESDCRFKIDGSSKLCRRSGEFLCVEDLNTNLPNLSHSARSMWVRCRYQYYLYKVKGIQAKRDKISSPLKYGTMWDKFQENKYGESHNLSQLADDLNMTELEIARFNAITSVFNKLKLATRNEDQYELQKKIVIPGRECNIVGYLDRAYDDYFVEVKMSMRPQYYIEPFNIGYQVGTYFLANPNWKYVIMEVTRVPGLAFDSEKEDIGMYEARLAKDIYKRAPMYFPGLKRKECTYGKKFFRSEFPLEEINKTYERISKEIKESATEGEDAFYKSFNCANPYPCDYLPICRDGVVSKTLFTMRKTGEEDIDEI